jgi:hypothetical protein
LLFSDFRFPGDHPFMMMLSARTAHLLAMYHDSNSNGSDGAASRTKLAAVLIFFAEKKASFVTPITLS